MIPARTAMIRPFRPRKRGAWAMDDRGGTSRRSRCPRCSLYPFGARPPALRSRCGRMVYQYESTGVNTKSGVRRHKSAICVVDDRLGVACATVLGVAAHRRLTGRDDGRNPACRDLVDARNRLELERTAAGVPMRAKLSDRDVPRCQTAEHIHTTVRSIIRRQPSSRRGVVNRRRRNPA